MPFHQYILISVPRLVTDVFFEMHLGKKKSSSLEATTYISAVFSDSAANLLEGDVDYIRLWECSVSRR